LLGALDGSPPDVDARETQNRGGWLGCLRGQVGDRGAGDPPLPFRPLPLEQDLQLPGRGHNALLGPLPRGGRRDPRLVARHERLSRGTALSTDGHDSGGGRSRATSATGDLAIPEARG